MTFALFQLGAPSVCVGEALAQTLADRLPGWVRQHQVDAVGVSLLGVRAATASFLVALFQRIDSLPLACVPVFVDAAPEVEFELRTLLAAWKRACLISRSPLAEDMLVDVCGSLDLAQRETLEHVYRHGPVTGAELGRQYPEKRITPSAWNNRLADLRTQRLVTFVRQGREVVYRAVGARLEPELP